MPHNIVVFSGGCNLCKDTIRVVEIGKCRECRLKVLDINEEENKYDAKRYGITSVPSIVIDDKIKVVGTPKFPWFCGDDFYMMLEKKYPLLTNPS